jgi:hypothetical protein
MQQLGLTTAAKFSDLQTLLNLLFAIDVPDSSIPAMRTMASVTREDRTILTKIANVLSMPESLVPPVFLLMNPQLQQHFSLLLVTMDAFEAAVASILLDNRCKRHGDSPLPNRGAPVACSQPLFGDRLPTPQEVVVGHGAVRTGWCCELEFILMHEPKLLTYLQRISKWQKDKVGTDNPMPILPWDTAMCVLPSYLQMRFPCTLEKRSAHAAQRRAEHRQLTASRHSHSSCLVAAAAAAAAVMLSYRLVDIAGKIARALEQPHLFPASIFPDPDVERYMEQKHLYVGHLLKSNPDGSRFPPTRIIYRCDKPHEDNTLLSCASCLQLVIQAIQAVLKEAEAGGWAKEVNGIVSDQSTGAASRGLILKGIGTRGLAGITFDIPSSYLNTKGEVADGEQLNMLGQRVLSSMQLGMQGLPFARDSAMLTQSQAMCVRQTHYQLQYLVTELKSAEVRQFHLNWQPARTMASPNFSEGQADTMELNAQQGLGLPTDITHALLEALHQGGTFARFSRAVLTDLQQWQVPSSPGAAAGVAVTSRPARLSLVSRSATTRVDMGVSVCRFASYDAMQAAMEQWTRDGVVHQDVTAVLDEDNSFAAARVFLVEVCHMHPSASMQPIAHSVSMTDENVSVSSCFSSAVAAGDDLGRDQLVRFG